MKKVIKKNQVIITSLAILIAVAGYLNFADVDLGVKDKESITVQSIKKTCILLSVMHMDMQSLRILLPRESA